ncbi:hypothetical protein OIV83_006412 [Microbotryomycetes sp. JL201]|nr:hypothetical protein OIV83_006412 [Microbotryomycetes sp. JL201]
MPPKRKTAKSTLAREALIDQSASLNTAHLTATDASRDASQLAKSISHHVNDTYRSNDGSHSSRVGYAVVELQAMLDTFELDATSKLQALRRNQMLRLDAMRRHWQAATAAIDTRIHDMTMREFVTTFSADHDAALRSVVSASVQQAASMTSQVEQSARKRKRGEQHSPVNSTNRDTSTCSTKRVRGQPTKLTEARKDRATKSSATKQSVRGARLRLRSDLQNDHNDAGARTRMSVECSTFNTQLPATPSIRGKSATRRPRRGESIVIQSVNGSPLGEFVASELDSNDLGSDTEGLQDDADDWDIMDRHEASQAEDIIRRPRPPTGLAMVSNAIKKNPMPAPKINGPLKHKTGSRSATQIGDSAIPAANGFQFQVTLPSTAPSYEELKLKVIEDMRADLARKVMSQDQRAHLLESLEAFIKAG